MLIKRACLLIISATLATAFAPIKSVPSKTFPLSAAKDFDEDGTQNVECVSDRRAFVSSLCVGGILSTSIFPAVADDGDEESFASIAARASRLSGDIAERTPITVVSKTGDNRTAYDFSVPMYGQDIPFKSLVRQEYDGEGIAKLKAILVVNMKEDDPVARKDIPEFIALAAKYVVARSSKVM
jgi:hypothetical protein